jgi:hypothetical protein
MGEGGQVPWFRCLETDCRPARSSGEGGLDRGLGIRGSSFGVGCGRIYSDRSHLC